MAKKTQKSAAASKPMSKKERAAAEAAAAREAERKAQNAQKNRQMGMVFLYAVLSLIALFCFYTLINALFFPAASVSELRDNLLFLSTVSIPYLIGAAAVIVHAVVKRRSRGTSDRAGRSHRILFLLVLAAAVLMFSSQLLGGKTDVSEHPALKNTVAALAQSEAGIGFQPDASSAGFRSMLESMSIEGRYSSGSTAVLMNYHSAQLGLAKAYAAQAARDSAGLERQSVDVDGKSVSLWQGAEGDNLRACICLQRGDTVLIYQLLGPAQEVSALLRPLCQAAADSVR